MPALDFTTTVLLTCLVSGLFALGGLLTAPTLRGAMPSITRMTVSNTAVFLSLVYRTFVGVAPSNLFYATYWSLWLLANLAMISAMRHGLGFVDIDRRLGQLFLVQAAALFAAALATKTPALAAVVACVAMGITGTIGVFSALRTRLSSLNRPRICLALAFFVTAAGGLLHLPMRLRDLLSGALMLEQTPVTYVMLLAVLLASNIGMMLMLYLRLVQHTGNLALIDELTGAHNRRGLSQYLRDYRTRTRAWMAGSIVMIDIDFFKRINDTHGHGVGDRVLQWFAENLRRHLRHEDRLVRLGGEEFCLLLPDLSIEQARDMALRMCTEFSNDLGFDIGGQALRLTASFGIASLGGEGHSVRQALRHADEALYLAKHGGRNQVVCWSPEAVLATHPFDLPESTQLAV